MANRVDEPVTEMSRRLVAPSTCAPCCGSCLKDELPRGLGSPLTAVQSVCHQREQFRRRGDGLQGLLQDV
jgi:hypothetical protein